MTLSRQPTTRTTVPLRAALERFLGDWPMLPIEGGLTELAPPLDVRETDNSYIVEIDLPGMNPDDVEVLIEGRTLTIRGEFAEEREEDQGNFLLRERRRGRFMRAVALPGMVEVDQVTSRFENGQLIIELPKAAQNRARRVEIGSGGGAGIQGGDQSGARGDGGAERQGDGGADNQGPAGH